MNGVTRSWTDELRRYKYCDAEDMDRSVFEFVELHLDNVGLAEFCEPMVDGQWHLSLFSTMPGALRTLTEPFS